MNLTPEQFGNAAERLSSQISGMARFDFEGIAKDDFSNFNLIFDNPIGLEVFFRNFSMFYDSNAPVFEFRKSQRSET